MNQLKVSVFFFYPPATFYTINTAAWVPSWLHSVFWQSTAVCFLYTGLEKKTNILPVFHSRLGKWEVSSEMLINVHLSPGRTSADPLWPPSWCSPACHRGCSSCTSGTLTTVRKHFTLTDSRWQTHSSTPVCQAHPREGRYLSAGEARFSPTWWRSRWEHRFLSLPLQPDTEPETSP